MFDPQTAALIRAGPKLPDLVLDRLPEEMTRVFAEIVALRLRLATGPAHLPAEVIRKLEEFRRIAVTYEAMVLLMPSREDRSAAAFVAAQTHHLLHLARRAQGGIPPPVLSAESISPEISALLLFLIANQPSDAMEMAREIGSAAQEQQSVLRVLTAAICALGKGELGTIGELSYDEQILEDYEEAAVAALYGEILAGIKLFADFVLHADRFRNGPTEAMAIFLRVQKISVEAIENPIADFADSDNTPPVSSFAGPHHLASLLLGAAANLGHAALAAVPSPPGLDGSAWSTLVSSIATRRPFLWPNHLAALELGFLNPGTSSVVSFPTGGGKTTLSELKIATVLANGGAVIYLAPTHALVGQTKRDLTNAFSVPVRESFLVEDYYAEIEDEIDGNVTQIVVMTPERCLALLSVDAKKFVNVRLVIFDECHLLHPKVGGQNRRSLDAMFAVLQLCEASPHSDWLLLSAMVKNGEEMAFWLQEIIGRKCVAIGSTWKPTRQARGCLVFDQVEITAMRQSLRQAAENEIKTKGKLGNPGVRVLEKLSAKPHALFGLQHSWETLQSRNYTLLSLSDQVVPLSASASDYGAWYLTPNKNAVAVELASHAMKLGLKVLLFSQSARDTTAIARNINASLDGEAIPGYLPHEKALVDSIAEEVGNLESVYQPFGRAASHNAMLLPLERELAESVFRRSDGVSALAATATLAQGMNLPADVVVIVGDERFDDEEGGFAPLDAHELLNAAGRAGRAGLVAQGVVIVIPHTFVEFNPADRTKIGNKWLALRESVFSKTDQCLVVDDPIRFLMDKLQDAANNSDPEMRYFFRRLPRGNIGDPERPVSFLKRTFGAWRARQKGEEIAVMKLISSALARRDELVPTGADDWSDEMSFRTGIATEFLISLDAALPKTADATSFSIEQWVRWFFTWLASDPRWPDAVFNHRLPKKIREEMAKQDLFGGKLADVVWGWMSGETLVTLNFRLGGKKDKPGKCDRARKFVLKAVPDLAFAAGIASRLKRRQIDVAGGRMPIDLAVLGACIREGLPEPETLVIRRLSPQLSRASAIRFWKMLQEFAPPRDSFEEYSSTRNRVLNAMRKHAEFLLS